MAKTTKKKTSKPRAQPDRLVKVDASLKKKYDELISHVEAAKREGASAFDTLWETVGAIVEHEPPLYVIGGFKNDTEFFREVLGEKRRNAYRFIRVAKFASPHEEDRYTVTRLDAALGYIQAKLGAPLLPPPLPVAFDRLRIPVEQDGKSVSVPLEDARVEDVLAATRALSRTAHKPKNPAEHALRSAIAKDAALKDVRLHVRGGAVSFTAVPLSALAKFVSLLAKVKVPPPPPARSKKPKRDR